MSWYRRSRRSERYGDRYGWRPYVPVAQRRAQAAAEIKKIGAKGQSVSPVLLTGRAIASTFWGKAWCANLERYSDYANRLPRGRSYVRNGSVVDLQVAPGVVNALVSGSSIYRVAVKVTPMPAARWTALCADCAGGIDSLVELLQGRFAAGVMERICQQQTGLFPAPAEIALSCSCPDWASMCKHVAAVLYGVGARLDERPELLFTLRQVDHQELIARAGADLPLSRHAPAQDRVLAGDGLSALFGIELGEAPLPAGGAAGQAEAATAVDRATDKGRATDRIIATVKPATIKGGQVKGKVTKAKATKKKVTKAKATKRKATRAKATRAKTTKAKVTKRKATRAKATRAQVGVDSIPRAAQSAAGPKTSAAPSLTR